MEVAGGTGELDELRDGEVFVAKVSVESLWPDGPGG